MKKTISVLALLLLTFVLPAFAAADYSIVKVQPSVIRTPQYTFIGDQRRTGQALQWLEVEVNFMSNVPFTDELMFRYYILIGGKCLTGEVTHVSIPKGRDLFSVMYVSPRTLEQVLGGKAITGSSIENVGVQMVLKGQVVDTKSYKEMGNPQWWQGMQQIPGLVFNKNDTPFAPLYWDRYEQIKPSGR